MAELIVGIVEAGEQGKRLDSYASSLADITRNSATILIQKSEIKVNGSVQNKSYKLKIGDQVEINIPDLVEVEIVPEDITLEIVYEDSDLLIVNKPKGMVVHPAVGHQKGTLVNALMHHCGDSLSGINGEIRPGIVHRIDKDTSGLLIVAKNDFAHNKLAEQIREHSFTREYETIVNGSVKVNGTVDAPISRHKNQRKKMCVSMDENARNAVTHYQVIENHGNFTHLKVQLETGRTHQIRVHLAYIGHGVVGDNVYSNGKPKWLNGQCLHAKRIGFIHPRSGEYMEFNSQLPDYFVKLLKNIDRI